MSPSSCKRHTGLGATQTLFYRFCFTAFFLWCLLPLASSPHAEPAITDFDSAMRGVHFDPMSDANGAGGENGIPDAIEMALLAAILKDSVFDLSAQGGADHKTVHLAYRQALKSAQTDVAALMTTWTTAAELTAAYAMLGKASFDSINRMSAGFGAPLKGDYELALSLDKLLSAEGDADGDGFSNRQEYHANKMQGREAYVKAALDPTKKPTEAQLKNMAAPKNTRLTVGIVLYPGFEVLDVYGPLEMWAYVPDFNIVFIAETAGPVNSAQGVATVATHSFKTAPALDILMVPGGTGSIAEVENQALIDYIAKTDKNTRYTSSVCTGSALLAKAGVLDGHRATTNKRAFYFAEQQSGKVEWIVNARWVESGKILTSSGVSAGTDMALGLVAKLYGLKTARELANSVEYEWHEDAQTDPFARFVNRLITSADGEKQLVKTEPEANQRLETAPRFLRLYFTGLPRVAESTVKLYPAGDRSKSIALQGMHNMGNNDLMIAVDEPLKDGEYIVKWQAGFDTDSPKLAGSFRFTVDTTRNVSKW